MKRKLLDNLRKTKNGAAAVLCLLALLLAGCTGGGETPPRPEFPEEDLPEIEEPAASEEPPAASAPAESEPPAESSPSDEKPEEEEPEEQYLTYALRDYASAEVLCNGKKGTLIVVKTKAKNETDQSFHLHQTLVSAGKITTDNVQDGMSADAVFAGKPAEQLLAQVQTDREKKKTKSVVAAVDGVSEEIPAGQSAIVYLYVFVPEEEGTWQKLDFFNGESLTMYLTPKPAQTPSKEPEMPERPDDVPSSSEPPAEPEKPAASPGTSEPPASSEQPAASERPAESPSAPETPSTPEQPEESHPDSGNTEEPPAETTTFPSFALLNSTVTTTGIRAALRIQNTTAEPLDLENSAAPFLDPETGAFQEDRLYQAGVKSRWVSSRFYLKDGSVTDAYPCYVVTSGKSTILRPGASAEVVIYAKITEEEKAGMLRGAELFARCGEEVQQIPDVEKIFIAK